MQGRLLECKFHCENLGALSAHLARSEATLRGVSDDVDHYYEVPSGTLKVRVTSPADAPDGGSRARLIAYTRHTADVGSDCGFIVVDVPEPAELMAALSLVQRSAGVVAKRREAWEWRGSRIHLDQVHRIGAFVECETPVMDSDEIQATRNHDDIVGLVRPFVGGTEAMSYFDLLNCFPAWSQPVGGE